jgi:hypothetical protein
MSEDIFLPVLGFVSLAGLWAHLHKLADSAIHQRHSENLSTLHFDLNDECRFTRSRVD